MQFPHEGYARDLHAALKGYLSANCRNATSSFSGRGVNWMCDAELNESSCSIHCFDQKGPEYLVQLSRNGHGEAVGRTAEISDVIHAVGDWLNGAPLGDLYGSYPFIDQGKRALLSMRDEIFAQFPSMQGLVESNIHDTSGSGTDEMVLARADRSCRIFFYGRKPFPLAIFSWDGCEQFRFSAENVVSLAQVVEQWILRRSMPSDAGRQFSWLKLNPVAEYYERGEPVLGEFMVSWDGIEDMFSDPEFSPSTAVISLIQAMRAKGYDKTLRAGQSMFTLMLSRSRRHGLRDGQPSMALQFSEGRLEAVLDEGHGERQELSQEIEFTRELECLLQKLVSREID